MLLIVIKSFILFTTRDANSYVNVDIYNMQVVNKLNLTADHVLLLTNTLVPKFSKHCMR